MLIPRFSSSRVRESGSAIIVVLAALGLLLSLGVPFLLAGRMGQTSDGYRVTITSDTSAPGRLRFARRSERSP